MSSPRVAIKNFYQGAQCMGSRQRSKEYPSEEKAQYTAGQAKLGGKEDINLHRTIAKAIQTHKKRNSVQLSAITLDEKARQFKMMSEATGNPSQLPRESVLSITSTH